MAEEVEEVELASLRRAQVNEALSVAYRFTADSGTTYQFKPMRRWSYRCERALRDNRFEEWARHALADPDQLEELLDEPGEDWVNIIDWFVEKSGVSQGEERKPSTSSKPTRKK